MIAKQICKGLMYSVGTVSCLLHPAFPCSWLPIPNMNAFNTTQFFIRRGAKESYTLSNAADLLSSQNWFKGSLGTMSEWLKSTREKNQTLTKLESGRFFFFRWSCYLQNSRQPALKDQEPPTPRASSLVHRGLMTSSEGAAMPRRGPHHSADFPPDNTSLLWKEYASCTTM